jgi:predicted metal-dependent enzyme (double-stranded beta helix superfamily)
MLTVETPLTRFVADIETLVLGTDDPYVITAEVRQRLVTLLAEPALLTPQQREPDPAHYRSHLLAVAPSRTFSVVGLVWLPGQMTPIHDHICWCVVGVVQGVEREQRYGLRADETGEHFLVPDSGETLIAGHTCELIPPEENIHQVRNAGDDLAISLHVYGADIGVYGSSINQCFDELPVRGLEAQGTPIAWRRRR